MHVHRNLKLVNPGIQFRVPRIQAMNEHALRNKLELNVLCIKNTKFTPQVTLECVNRKDTAAKRKATHMIFLVLLDLQRAKYRHRIKK